jgi:hypothetical protein
MSASRSASERLVVLEQKVSHMEEELDKMAAKVDEMHAILLVGFLAGISHWLISKA